MDGHDNDADKATGNTGAQGIFSTPELTVDTEKLAQNTKQNQRSRVASIFANTDAGQRSQKLDDAMGLNSIAPAQITEDIKLDNAPRKRSKAPIIIAIVALLAVIGGFTTWMIVKNVNLSTTVAQTPSETFTNYKNLLQYGTEQPSQSTEPSDAPSENSSNNSTWFFFDLDNNNLLNDEKVQYLETLRQKYQDFVVAFEKNTDTKNHSEVQKLLPGYEQSVLIMINSAYLEHTDELLVKKYSDEGAASATKYVNELAPQLPEDTTNYPLQNLSSKLNEYLEDQIKLIQIYDNWGCVRGGIMDRFCEDGIDTYNTAYQQLTVDQAKNSKMIQTYFKVMAQYFMQDTNKIEGLLNEN